jgi:sec-independent protein translocase protein TatC
MNEANDIDETKMSFMDHLEELRRRLIICSIALGIGFLICYGFSQYLFELLAAPLVKSLPKGDKLIYTALTEAFFTYLKVGLIGGALLASPVIFYQLWRFVSPGLYKHEKRFVIPFVVCSSLLFMGGAFFGYSVVFPVGFKYFLGFSSDYVKALPSMKQYLSFSATLLLGFGLSFELPLVTLLLARMGIVTGDMMRKKRKFAIVAIFVVAAIITPTPDAINQLLMAGPLLVLYEASIILAKVFGKKKTEHKEGKEQKEGHT